MSICCCIGDLLLYWGFVVVLGICCCIGDLLLYWGFFAYASQGLLLE